MNHQKAVPRVKELENIKENVSVIKRRMSSSNTNLVRAPEASAEILNQRSFEKTIAKNFLEQMGDVNQRFRNHHVFQVKLNVLNPLQRPIVNLHNTKNKNNIFKAATKRRGNLQMNDNNAETKLLNAKNSSQTQNSFSPMEMHLLLT